VGTLRCKDAQIALEFLQLADMRLDLVTVALNQPQDVSAGSFPHVTIHLLAFDMLRANAAPLRCPVSLEQVCQQAAANRTWRNR